MLNTRANNGFAERLTLWDVYSHCLLIPQCAEKLFEIIAAVIDEMGIRIEIMVISMNTHVGYPLFEYTLLREKQ